MAKLNGYYSLPRSAQCEEALLRAVSGVGASDALPPGKLIDLSPPVVSCWYSGASSPAVGVLVGSQRIVDVLAETVNPERIDNGDRWSQMVRLSSRRRTTGSHRPTCGQSAAGRDGVSTHLGSYFGTCDSLATRVY